MALEIHTITVLHPPSSVPRIKGGINNTEITKKKKSASLYQKVRCPTAAYIQCALQFTHNGCLGRTHAVLNRLSLLFAIKKPTRHRTKMPRPTPSSTTCKVSNIWILEMSSFLKIAAVSSSNVAVWLHREREKEAGYNPPQARSGNG